MWLTYCHLMVKSRNQLDRGYKFSRMYYRTKFQGPPLHGTGAIITWETCCQQTGSKGGVAFSDMSSTLIFTETFHLVQRYWVEAHRYTPMTNLPL